MTSDPGTLRSHSGVPIATGTTGNLLSETTRSSSPSIRRPEVDRSHGAGAQSTSPPGPPPEYSSLRYEMRDLWGEAAKKLTPDQLGVLKVEDTTSHNSRNSTTALVTLKGVLKFADEQAKKKQDKKWKKRWYSLVKSLKRFDALVQAGLDFDPTPYGALVWQVVSFGIEASINNSDIQDLVYESSEYVKDIIDEYALYEARYLNPSANDNGTPTYQASLRAAIINVYATVLRYAAELRYYLSHMGDQIKAALSGPVETSSLAKFRQIIEEKRRSSCDILSKLQMELSEAQISAIDGKIDYIKYQLSKMQEYITLQEDTLVLNWISTVTMDEQQKTQRNAAERDGRGNQKPGDWMLREREYVTWNDSASEESRTLWLSGEVGTGKSIVTSTVVKDCQGDYGKEIYGPTAYFYCSGIPGNSQREVNAEDILRSILRQLVQWSEATIDVARAQWVLLQRRMQTQFEVEDLIKQIVSHEETLEATIIIDGLDELTTSCLNDLLTSLEVLMAAKGTVKIFLASRPLSQVARCLSNIRGSEVVITPAHTEENMAFYIDTTITAKTKRIESKYIAGDLDARIRKLLTDSARGVFRYVELALSYIFDNVWLIENKVKELELELEPEPEQKYPKQAFVDNALNPMYNKIYRLIAKDLKEQQLLAHRIIKWLLCEVYPLPAKELIKGVCMDASSPEAKVLNEKNKSGLLDVNDVLSACHHLVVYYKSTDRLDFGHFSVVEFLKGPSMAIFENSMAHCTLSSACFHVLFSITDFNSLDTDRQLETYAMFNWAWHYKNSEEPEGVTDVQNLFSKFWKEDEYFSKTVASTESRIVSFVNQHGERKESGAIFRTIASQWSSLSLGRTLQLPKREQQLIVGCVFDMCEPVKELLGLSTWYFGRNLEISPSSIVIGCKLALRFGSLRALEELVEGPVDIDMLEADGCPLLHHAVSTLNLKSVKFCLGRFSRAINIVATSFIEESWNTTPLIVALLSMDYRNPRNDKNTITELLRVPGIDVNASGSGGRTALHVAMSSSSVTLEIVKELVEHGCKGIFQRDYDGMTPMVIGEREREHNAASLAAEFARTGAQGAEGEGEERTNIEVDDASRKLRLLDDAEPPVQKAAREGNDPTDLDAIIKESKWEGKAILDLTTALHLAAENANMGCLKVLLKSGLVDVDSQDGNGMTALMAAVLSRKWDVVKFLRSRGASPTMETQQGRSALTFAAKEGKLNGLKAVLSAIPGRDTVDVNHQDTFGGLTALHYACMKRFNEEIEPPGKFDENLDLVEELLFHGADIHIMDNNGRTPLQIAMINGKHDVVAKLSGLGPQDSQAEGTTIQSEIDHPTTTSQGNTIQNIQADKQILRVEFYTFIHFLYAIAWWLARGTRALFLGVLSTMIPPGALNNDTSSAKDGMVRDNFASWSSISAVVPGATQRLELDEEFEKSLSRFM